jgi:hypothetical protein
MLDGSIESSICGPEVMFESWWVRAVRKPLIGMHCVRKPTPAICTSVVVLAGSRKSWLVAYAENELRANRFARQR